MQLKHSASLGSLHTTKSGYPFYFFDSEWRLDGSTVINFNQLADIDKDTALGFRRTVCRYAEELSAKHTYNMVYYFSAYFRFTGTRTVTLVSLVNYRASLNDANEYKLGALKGFLLAWYEWGFKGITSEVADYLEELILKGNPKGNAVKGACPYSGPLTHNELGALIDWASNAFTQSLLNLKEYSCFMSLALTGRRYVQIRALRSVDLVVREDENGNDYVINCPRAKQHDTEFRGQFTPLPINEDLYLLLHNQRNKSIQYVESQLGRTLPSTLREQIPIFLEEPRVDELTGLEALKSILTKTPDYLHMTTKLAQEILRGVSVKNTAYSERTGDYINFTASRFRYTKATNLARRGIRGVSLAAALDQSDTQQVGIYCENTEETAKQIDEIMAPMLATLAQAFAGKLIASERDAVRANDPNSRVKNGKSDNVGNCGTYAFCASGYRACYTCSSFQPWLEAPHEEVLNEILAERKKQQELSVSKNVIQSTDRLLLAVQQVIIMCKQASSEGDL
ncbi:site-specific integrase [Shewanella metallivivens]|uniref:Site-specific integrase n=1 Tax=Shewanella metallivivens TaxID=2872342 RepID=A0ABT5TNM9_9GAMM|nr:site-specific integrase [Shewanella metallivivens]MDD8060215.1 site-specific integrase [Shewanella metallivivens]